MASRIPRKALLSGECLGERPQLIQSPSSLTIPGRTPGTPPTVYAFFLLEKGLESTDSRIYQGRMQHRL